MVRAGEKILAKLTIKPLVVKDDSADVPAILERNGKLTIKSLPFVSFSKIIALRGTLKVGRRLRTPGETVN